MLNMYEYEHVFPDKVSVTLPLHLTGYYYYFLYFLFFKWTIMSILANII